MTGRAIDDPVQLARAARIIRAAVKRSRAAQGLPPTVEDPAVLDQVAEILGAGKERQP